MFVISNTHDIVVNFNNNRFINCAIKVNVGVPNVTDGVQAAGIDLFMDRVSAVVADYDSAFLVAPSEDHQDLNDIANSSVIVLQNPNPYGLTKSLYSKLHQISIDSGVVVLSVSYNDEISDISYTPAALTSNSDYN